MTLYKGLDDLLAAGKLPVRIGSGEIEGYLQQLEQSHKSGNSADESPDVLPAVEKPPRPAFPVDVFPKPLKSFVYRVAAATGCPTDFPGVAVLVVAATAIGAARALGLKASWVEQAGIYAAIVASPGRGKTPALKAVMKPLYEEQDRLRNIYREDQARYREGIKIQKKAERRDDLEELVGESSSLPSRPPSMQHVYTSDATVEAIAANLETSPKGFLIFFDELTAWVHNMNRYRSGADRQFFLSAWSNSPIKVDRKMDQDGPTVVSHPFLCVLGGVQPDVLSTLEAAGGGQDGFLERLLFAYPEDQPFPGWTEEEIDRGLQQEWKTILDRLFTLQPLRPDGESDRPHILQFTENGKRAFATFDDELATEMNEGGLPPKIVGAWAKLPSYAARFALVIHLLRWATSELDQDWDEGEVDEEDVRRAVLLCDYFKQHVLAVHRHLRQLRGGNQVDALLNWARRNGRTELSARDIRRDGVAGIKLTAQAEELMRTVADQGYGTLVRPSKGRQKPRLLLNQTDAVSTDNQGGD